MGKGFEELNDKLDEIIVLLRIIIMQEAPVSEGAEAGPIQPLQPQLTPLYPQPYPYPTTPEPAVNQAVKCPKCAIDFSGTVGYVCSDVDCGMGLGPSICGV